MVSLIGLSNGTLPVVWAMFADYFEPRFVGTAAGLLMFIGGVGNMLGAPIAGSLAVTTGTLATAFQVSIVMQVVTVIISLSFKNPPS